MMYKEINSSRLSYKIDSYSGGIAVSPVMPSTYSGGDKDFKAAFLKNAQKADAKKDAKDEEVLLENVEYENSKIEDEFVRDEAAAFGAEKAVEFDKFQSEKSDKLESAKHAGGAQASAFVIDSSEQAVVTSYGSTSSGDAYEPDPVPDSEPNSSTTPPSDLKSKLANIDCVNTNLGVLILLFLANEVYPEQYKALNDQNLINLSLLQVQSDWLTLSAKTVVDKSKDIMDESNQAALYTLIGACASMGVSFIGAGMQSWSHWKTFNANKDNGLAQEGALAHQLKTSMDSYDINRTKIPEQLKNVETLKSEVAANNNKFVQTTENQAGTIAELVDKTKKAGNNQAVAEITNSNAVEQEVAYVKKLGDAREEAATATDSVDFIRKDGVDTATWDDPVLTKDIEDYANLPQMNKTEFEACVQATDTNGFSSNELNDMNVARRLIKDHMYDTDGSPMLMSNKPISEADGMNPHPVSNGVFSADENHNCYITFYEKHEGMYPSFEGVDNSRYVKITYKLGKSRELGGWINSRQNNKTFMLNLKVTNPSAKALMNNPWVDNPWVDRVKLTKEKEECNLIDSWQKDAKDCHQKALDYIDNQNPNRLDLSKGSTTGNADLDKYLSPDSTTGFWSKYNDINDSDTLHTGVFKELADKSIEYTKPSNISALDKIGRIPNSPVFSASDKPSPLEFSNRNKRRMLELDEEITKSKFDTTTNLAISKVDLDKFAEKLYKAERLRPEMENYKTTMLDQLRTPQDGAAAGIMYSKITNSKNAARYPAEQTSVWGSAMVSGLAPGINGIASYFSQTTQAKAENDRSILNSTTQVYGSEEQITVQLMHTISGYISTAWQNLVQTVGGLMQSAVQASQFMR